MKLTALKFLTLLLATLFLVASVTGCSFLANRTAGEGAEGEMPAGEEPASRGRLTTIRLAENFWPGSQVNVAIAKQLLEEELGYQVEVVSIDENLQWEKLASGEIHASLEVWPSGHQENIQRYIEEQQLVEEIGLLGPVGKIGWYVPTYVLVEHPELQSWEGFRNPELARLFATDETGDKGRFLAGDPSWVQYDEDIIRNLGLHLQVVHAGSEEALLAEVNEAYQQKAPILFYFYTPHSIFAEYDLTEVRLPSYNEACYTKEAEGGIDCDYPPDALFKIVWSGLKKEAPDAYTFLQNFQYTSRQQIQLIAAIEAEGHSPEEAASEWIKGNQQIWQEWLP